MSVESAIRRHRRRQDKYVSIYFYRISEIFRMNRRNFRFLRRS